MWQFLLGLLLGAQIGIIIHCLFLVNKKENNDNE